MKKIEFDLRRNAHLGQGLVIVDGKFYGLPLEAAIVLSKLGWLIKLTIFVYSFKKV